MSKALVHGQMSSIKQYHLSRICVDAKKLAKKSCFTTAAAAEESSPFSVLIFFNCGMKSTKNLARLSVLYQEPGKLQENLQHNHKGNVNFFKHMNR